MDYALLASDPQIRSFRRIFTAGTTTLLIILWLAVAAKRATPETGLLISAFLVAWWFVLSAIFSWARRGKASIDAGGIVVRRGVGQVQFPWSDVVDVQLQVSHKDGAFARVLGPLSGIRSGETFVEVRLRRRARLGLVPGRHGTSVAGVPLPCKFAQLFITAADDFVAAAHSFLSSSTT